VEADASCPICGSVGLKRSDLLLEVGDQYAPTDDDFECTDENCEAAMKHYAKRRDATHGEIKAVFVAHGLLVLEGETIDFTLYDALTGRIYLADAKAKANSRKTERQLAMVRDGWPVAFPASAEDAENLVAQWRKS
jgi:hypothetical protein